MTKVIVKIELEWVDMQKEISVETLLDSKATGLVISIDFSKKHGFKFKKSWKNLFI